MGLHCEHRPASKSFGYIKQGQSNSMDAIPVGDDATGASGTGPVMGYSLKLKCFILFIFVLFLNTCTCFVSLTMVVEILFIYMFNFEIKICLKMSISLIVQRFKKRILWPSIIYLTIYHPLLQNQCHIGRSLKHESIHRTYSKHA